MIPYVRKPASDEALVKYFYEELIMSLITMSLSAEEQKYMIGIGCTGDEILEGFSNFYIERRQFYLGKEVFNDKQIEILDKFEKFLHKYNGRDEDFYWNFEQLRSNPLWEELREQSKIVISQVFGKKYRIEIEREDEFVNGKTIEHTRRKLIEIED